MSMPAFASIGFRLTASLAMLVVVLGPEVGLGTQLMLLGAGVVLVGVPHGAIDPLLANDLATQQGPRRMLGFLLHYLIQVALVIALWWASPALALAAFLVLSAWHFGGDWRHCLHSAQRWVAGTAVVLAPLVFHPEVTSQLFVLLSGPGGGAIVQAAVWLGWPACALLAAASIFHRAVSQADRFDWALLLLAAFVLPPLLYFAVYFCALHSVRHLRDAHHQTRHAGRRQWWLTAVGFTAITLLGAAVFLAIAQPSTWSQAGLQAIFIGLAALTVPHMTLMERVHAAWKARNATTTGSLHDHSTG